MNNFINICVVYQHYIFVGSLFKTPCSTRWNSLYDAFKDIKAKRQHMNQVAVRLELAPLHDEIYILIDEFLEVRKTIP